MTAKKESGFTLVELSIVLVIIGLLIGGILVGQSLIDSARVNRLVNDLQQYEVATVQFREKFKKYPGDSPAFIPPGNGNNVLDAGICAAAPNASLSSDEQYQVWAHLSQSQMLKANYPAYSPSATCAGGIHSWADYSTGKFTPYTEIKGVNGSVERYFMHATKGATRNFSFVFRTLPIDALALGNKLAVQGNNWSGTQIGLTNNGTYP